MKCSSSVLTVGLTVMMALAVAGQNVGIGTTSPTTPLHVVTGIGYGIQHQSGAVRLSTFIDANGGWFGTVSNHPFHLYTNDGLPQLTVLPNGNVGIGTINPQWKLDVLGRMRVKTGVQGNIFTTAGIWFDDYRDGSNRIFAGMQDSIRFGLYGEGGGGPGVAWGLNFNARTGSVGIGALPTSSRLEVNGEVKATSIKTDNIVYTSPKTFYYAITPSAFTVTVNYNPANPITWYYEETNNVSTDVNNISQFVAPVLLPDGATVTSMTIYYYDNSPTNDVAVTLRKRLYASSQYFLMGTAYSNGQEGDAEATTNAIAFAQINNALNVHSVLFSGTQGKTDALLKLKGVRIAYTMPGPQ